MTSDRADGFGFAPAHDAPIPYLQRIRRLLRALGYGAPYEWAHYADVPFQPLTKPLAQMPRRAHHHRGALPARQGRPGAGRALQRGGQVLHRLFGRHGDGTTTCASRTSPSTASTPRPRTAAPTFRCRRCARAAARGRIGSLAPRFHGLPTNRSHRTTLEVDCPEIVARCQADGVDAAILVPNCPVCHQSVSLAARALEESGIATVVMGCAKDIVEHVGVPRFLFSDFPLGNAAGRPHDADSQALTLELALTLLETRAGRAHHRAVAAALERQRRLEARLPEHRAAVGRGDRAPARRVRPQKGGREGLARGARLQRDKRRKAQRRHEQALRRRPRPRLHAGVRGAVRQLPAGAARRRRHQDRAAGRRGHAPQPAQQGVGGAQPGHRLDGHQLQQAQHRARPHQAQVDRDRAPPGREGRRGDGELPPRRHGQARHRLRGAVGESIRGSSIARCRASARTAPSARPPPTTARSRR